MALTRLNSFATGSVVTNAIATGEFDNIYNNALTLISPLTGDLAAGGNRITGLSVGSLASPSLQFTSDANTGIYSPAAEQVAIVCAGAAAATFTTGAVGPHAIGGATSANRQLILTGSFTAGAGTAGALDIVSTVTVAADQIAAGILLEPTLVEAGSGTHANLSGLDVNPTITAGAAGTTDLAGIRIRTFAAATGTTNATGLKIDAAPTAATNNYALWAAGGSVRIDGTCYINDEANANVTLGLTINQGANDDQILALKSSDVAHGVTAIAETDT